MSASPSVSIGLPVYNGERFLETSLRSVLTQTFEDFELIVSDNASTDRTGEICQDLAAGDARVRYSRNAENLGAAANYNRVFGLARAPYFKWAAHDDAYAPTFIERCLEVLEDDSDTVVCYSPAVFIDEDDREIGRETELLDYAHPRPSRRFHAWVVEKREGWCHPVTGVMRAEALRRTRLIAPFVGADVTLIAELVLRGRVRRTSDFLFYRRDHSGRSTAGQRTMQEMTEWFDPKARAGRAYLPRWRWGSEYMRAIARVPMPPLEKLACMAIMARWFVRSRSGLGRELARWTGTRRGPSPRGL